MKTKYFDIFRTEFRKEGVVPIFEKLESFKSKPFETKPIPYPVYANWINAEMQKLRKEPVTFECGCITTKHKGSYVWLDVKVNENITYKISKMKKAVYLSWFQHNYEVMLSIAKLA